MSKYCTQCGSEITDATATSCNFCGKVFNEAATVQAVEQSAYNQQNAYGQYNQPTQYNQQNAYGQYNQSQYGQQTQYNPQYYYPNNNYGTQQTNAPVGTSVGGWIGWLFLCSFLPIIGLIIMMCSAKDESTKNYAKANLIFMAIVLVLYILLLIVFGATFATVFEEMAALLLVR